MTAQLHPIFVYGTLLTGESAHHLLAPYLARMELAAAPRADLYSLGPFPMLVNGNGRV